VRFVTAPLSPQELELLELLVKADAEDAQEAFVAVYTSKGTAIKHTGFPVSEWRNDEAAVAGLEAAGILLVQSRENGYPKVFHLASTAAAELAEAKRHAVDEAKAAAAASRGVPPVSFAEALRRMIDLHKSRPGGFFTPYDTYPDRSIGYSGTSDRPIVVSHADFTRLITGGVLTQSDNRLPAYYLSPNAADILAAEDRLNSTGPLAAAERRLSSVETRRTATARWAGLIAAALVLMACAYLVLNREQLFPPGRLGGLIYELLTVVGGVTGFLIAFGVYRGVRTAVEWLLRWWLDPDADR
jgi:hypothetical protein